MKTFRQFQHSLRRQAAIGVFHALRHWAAQRPAAPRPHGRRALIVPPGAAGSLGDEAMFCGLRGLLERSGFEHITVASLSGAVPAHYLAGAPAGMQITAVQLSGYVRRLFDFAALAREHTHCFVIGADVMDAFYSLEVTRARCQLATLAAALGLETAITGFSLRDDVPPACVRVLQQTDHRVRLLMRDHVSLARLRAMLGERGELVADLAFMLRPIAGTPCVESARAWSEKERARGQTILGVNANYLLVQKIASSAEECVAVYARLLERLSAEHPEVSLLFIPHDLRSAREKVSDLDLCRLIAAQLSEPLRARSYVVEDCRSAGEVKEIVTCADLIFTGRMHLAIAAQGRAVPAAAVAYQGKFEGFYAHFGITDMQIAPGALGATESAARWLADRLAARTELRAKIAARLPAVQALAERNLPQFVTP